MPKFRQRPVEVRAVQFTGDNNREVEDFVGGAANYIARGIIGESGLPTLHVRTIDSDMHLVKGDWVIEGTDGRFRDMDDEGFQALYEAVG